ncbi:MAG: BMP family ABC transporter substrate-binding protein [Micrococcaceae bacterium]
MKFNKLIATSSVLAASSLGLTACGSAPSSTSASSSASHSDFTACMVSGTGGFQDKSFNQSSLDGLNAAQKDLGVQIKKAESMSTTDFAPNTQQMVQSDCGIIIEAGGFPAADVTKQSATANKDKKFVIVDDNSIQLDNVKPIVYDTAQAAFLAGYLSAAQTKTGKVATFGGEKIPAVTIFMDGYSDGVKYYNQKKGKNVQLLGWDKDAQNGTMIGSFTDQAKGKQLAESFLSQGADIVMPVAGNAANGAFSAAKDAGQANGENKLSIIGVDADGYEAQPDFKEYFLSSVQKSMSSAVEQVIKEAAENQFSSTPYLGTLQNNGVSIAPFHDYDSKVSQDTKNELDQIKQDIISGKLKVESQATPKTS